MEKRREKEEGEGREGWKRKRAEGEKNNQNQYFLEEEVVQGLASL